MTLRNELFGQPRSKNPSLAKYCHAEFISASVLDIVHGFRNEFGMTLRNELFGQSRSKNPSLAKYCHAEFISASVLDIVHGFRNEFGMTLRNELFGQPRSKNPSLTKKQKLGEQSTASPPTLDRPVCRFCTQ